MNAKRLRNPDPLVFVPLGILTLTFWVWDLLIYSGTNLLSCLIVDTATSSLVPALTYHRSSTGVRRNLISAFTLLLVVLSLLPLARCGMEGLPAKVLLAPGVCTLFVLCEKIETDRYRYRMVSRLFSNQMVGHRILDDLRVSHSLTVILVLALQLAALALPHTLSVATLSCLLAVSVLLAGLSCARYALERTFYMPYAKEEELGTILRGSLRTSELVDELKDRKMRALYRRLLELFEAEKPYLNEDLKLEDLARSLYTNKTYLSKTVNVLSGQNFRTFINYYRVEHSIELVRRDPHLKVEELAMLSGFHSSVSFGMSFRLFKGKSPSEWIYEYRETLK